MPGLALRPLLEQGFAIAGAEPLRVRPGLNPVQPEDLGVVRATVEDEEISPSQHGDERVLAWFTLQLFGAMVDQTRANAPEREPGRELGAVVGACGVTIF